MEGFEPVFGRGVLGVLKITIFEGSGFLGHKIFGDFGIFSRWWKMNPFWQAYFSDGWLNHQPAGGRHPTSSPSFKP